MPKSLKKYSLLGAVMLSALVLAGCAHEQFLGGAPATEDTTMQEESMMEGEAMEEESMEKEDAMMDGEEAMEKEGEAMESDEGVMMEGETKLEVEGMEVMEK